MEECGDVERFYISRKWWEPVEICCPYFDTTIEISSGDWQVRSHHRLGSPHDSFYYPAATPPTTKEDVSENSLLKVSTQSVIKKVIAQPSMGKAVWWMWWLFGSHTYIGESTHATEFNPCNYFHMAEPTHVHRRACSCHYPICLIYSIPSFSFPLSPPPLPPRCIVQLGILGSGEVVSAGGQINLSDPSSSDGGEAAAQRPNHCFRAISPHYSGLNWALLYISLLSSSLSVSDWAGPP